MTREDKNIIIMDFMELKPRLLGNQWMWSDSPFFTVIKYDREDVVKSMAEYVKYDTSWDSLMPVVAKINQVFDDADMLYYFEDTAFIVKFVGSLHVDVQDINGVYNNAVNAIQWYNENKTL